MISFDQSLVVVSLVELIDQKLVVRNQSFSHSSRVGAAHSLLQCVTTDYTITSDQFNCDCMPLTHFRITVTQSQLTSEQTSLVSARCRARDSGRRVVLQLLSSANRLPPWTADAERVPFPTPYPIRAALRKLNGVAGMTSLTVLTGQF